MQNHSLYIFYTLNTGIISDQYIWVSLLFPTMRKKTKVVHCESGAQFAWFYAKFDQYIYCDALGRVRAGERTHTRAPQTQKIYNTLSGASLKACKFAQTKLFVRQLSTTNTGRKAKVEFRSICALSCQTSDRAKHSKRSLALSQSHFAHDLHCI